MHPIVLSPCGLAPRSSCSDCEALLQAAFFQAMCLRMKPAKWSDCGAKGRSFVALCYVSKAALHGRAFAAGPCSAPTSTHPRCRLSSVSLPPAPSSSPPSSAPPLPVMPLARLLAHRPLLTLLSRHPHELTSSIAACFPLPGTRRALATTRPALKKTPSPSSPFPHSSSSPPS